MAEIASYSADRNELGRGLKGSFFHVKFWGRKTPSVPSLLTSSKNKLFKLPLAPKSKRDQGGRSSLPKLPPKLEERETIKTKPALVSPRPSISHHQNQTPRVSVSARSSTSSSNGTRKVSQTQDLATPKRPSISQHQNQTPRVSVSGRSSTSSSNGSSLKKVSPTQDLADVKRLLRETSGISTDLSLIISDRRQFNENKALVRATSGNIMLLGHLGNLRQSKPAQQTSTTPNLRNGIGRYGGNGTTGNIVRKPGNEKQWSKFSNGLDPEVLKDMGNEEYKQGRFEEALVLYNRAIALDSSKASYHSNKAAALTGLGNLIEAILECREAIRIEPYYHRAHHRLATLYLRLGDADLALSHYKYSSPGADSEYIAQAQALQTHLIKCSEAQKLRDWNTLLKETQWAISSGVDSAPEIYALQAEALLKLHRHQEAYSTFRKGPNFDVNSCTQFFGVARTSYLLMIQAQLYTSMGRLEDGVAIAQGAVRLDSSNKEACGVLRRVRAVASARSKGNQLFKASKFSEACAVYGEGLEHDPYNSLLLCNRAACRSKLGQFEKAIEDCTAALDVRPSYSKARLRRADCNAKAERWETAIQDYEALIRETPGDEEVGRALFEAQVELKRQRGEDIEDMEYGSNLVIISSNERFRHFVTSPGMSVVLFCNKTSHKQVLQLLDQVCKRFPSVNFLKVEVEDHPYLVKLENVSSIPAFKIYKNGSRVKEIAGNNRELLERSVKLYSSS